MHSREAQRGIVVENYHGTEVADPYRWLEDAASEETQSWVYEQNEISSTYFQSAGKRSQIFARLKELYDYPRYSAPQRKGGSYFFFHNTGLQNQDVLYMQKELDGQPAILLDPNLLSTDGTVALVTQVYSHDGTLMAYGVSTSGSDWQEIKIRRVATGEDYAEVIQHCKFASIAWKHDNSGFYYDRFPDPGSVAEEDQSSYNRVYWHSLGTPQEEDPLVYERPDDK